MLASLIGFLLAAQTILAVPSQTEQKKPDLKLAHRVAMHFPERPPVQFEVDLASDRGPRIIITNLYQYALTAVVIQREFAPGKGVSQTIVLDALTPSALLAAVPRGLSFVMSLPRDDRETLPDTRLVAAAWEDGSTYGSADLLQQVVAGRATTAGAYDRALSLLGEGLEKNWTASEYISAANELRNTLGLASPGGSGAQSSVAILLSITSSLQTAENSRGQMQVTRTAKSLADHFKESREALRLAAELLSPSSAPETP